MSTTIYATVGDQVKWIANPKGAETLRGERGSWQNIEGTVVVADIEANTPEEFAEKSQAIRVLWPAAVVRFTKTRRPQNVQ